MPNSANSSVVKLRRKGAPAQQFAPEAVLDIPEPPEGYQRTREEQRLVTARATTKARTALPAASFRLHEDKTKADIGFDHPDKAVAIALYSEALKTTTVSELYDLLTQISYFAQNEPRGTISESKFNAMVQTVANMRPRDITETMLCLQMVAVHQTTMQYASRLAHQRDIRVSESYERSLNKLARTYAAQMTTLKQYRSDGKQKIVVKHVTVNEGGQAIVGDVTHGGGAGGASENPEATA